MKHNKLIIAIIVIIVVLFIVLFVFGEKAQAPEAPKITVEYLKVNGEEGPLITLNLDDQSIITALVRNEDTEREAEISLSVRRNSDLFDGRHSWTYTIGPGETREIEEIREVHRTWYGGEFTVEIGDKLIRIVVQE